jgi:hypothetical protein
MKVKALMQQNGKCNIMLTQGNKSKFDSRGNQEEIEFW